MTGKHRLDRRISRSTVADITRRLFNEEMSTPELFNDCRCDMWPGGSPHRHITPLREEK